MAISAQAKVAWNFNESSGDAADAIGSNTLTNINTCTYTTGLLGNCAVLDGTNKRFSRADSTATSITGDLSISTWWNYNSDLDAGLVSKWGTAAAANRSFSLMKDATSHLISFRISSTGGSPTTVSWSHTPSNGTWYHYVLTYTASTHTAELWINGVSQGTQDAVKTSIYDGNQNISIGDEIDDGADTQDGKVDTTAIWNVVLTSADVAYLYNSGTGRAAPFSLNYQFDITVGDFTYTPNAIDIYRGYDISILPRNFLITFNPIDLTWNHTRNVSKNSASFSNVSKNSASLNNVSKNSSSWNNLTKNP